MKKGIRVSFTPVHKIKLLKRIKETIVRDFLYNSYSVILTLYIALNTFCTLRCCNEYNKNVKRVNSEEKKNPDEHS